MADASPVSVVSRGAGARRLASHRGRGRPQPRCRARRPTGRSWSCGRERRRVDRRPDPRHPPCPGAIAGSRRPGACRLRARARPARLQQRTTPASHTATHVVLESCIAASTPIAWMSARRLLPRRPELPDHRPRRIRIDCAVCIPECPVNAILPEEDVPGDQLSFIAERRAGRKTWPSITKRKAPLPGRRRLEGPQGQAGRAEVADPP